MRACIRPWAAVILGVVLAGCSSTGKPPQPGEPQAPVPDMRGRRAMVLPVQLRSMVPAGVTIDEEIAYALNAREGERVSWVFPPEVEGILRRSPGVQANLYSLPVEIFLQAEVNRIGDPLYGEIRRMTTLVGADFAIIPVQLEYSAEGRYVLVAALLNPVTGRVLWFGSVQGDPGAADAPETLASVTGALARTLLPGVKSRGVGSV